MTWTEGLRRTKWHVRVCPRISVHQITTRQSTIMHYLCLPVFFFSHNGSTKNRWFALCRAATSTGLQRRICLTRFFAGVLWRWDHRLSYLEVSSLRRGKYNLSAPVSRRRRLFYANFALHSNPTQPTLPHCLWILEVVYKKPPCLLGPWTVNR